MCSAGVNNFRKFLQRENIFSETLQKISAHVFLQRCFCRYSTFKKIFKKEKKYDVGDRVISRIYFKPARKFNKVRDYHAHVLELVFVYTM